MYKNNTKNNVEKCRNEKALRLFKGGKIKNIFQTVFLPVNELNINLLFCYSIDYVSFI